jgi:glycosyltransferase involved in cell wall biosynthesis
VEKLISCSGHYGGGGVGQHFAEAVKDARRRGQLGGYVGLGVKSGDPLGTTISIPWLASASRYTPLRFSPGWQNYLSADTFDRTVARWLERNPRRVPDTFSGFVGMSLHSFHAARRLGVRKLELYALNTHVHDVRRQHARAYADWPLERSWMNGAQVRKTLAEYEEADVIHIHSEHVWRTFVEHGVTERKLRRFELHPRPRFRPPAHPRKQESGVFEVVYVGGLSIWKGTPVLVEAFQRWDEPDARLTLVGGWGTRGMKRYMRGALQRDPRIRVAPGDPLPHLQNAHLYVHPSYNDGYPYSLQEALACGLPVIVTDQTGGYSEILKKGSGVVIGTGNMDALAEALAVAKERSSKNISY